MKRIIELFRKCLLVFVTVVVMSGCSMNPYESPENLAEYVGQCMVGADIDGLRECSNVDELIAAYGVVVDIASSVLSSLFDIEPTEEERENAYNKLLKEWYESRLLMGYIFADYEVRNVVHTSENEAMFLLRLTMRDTKDITVSEDIDFTFYTYLTEEGLWKVNLFPTIGDFFDGDFEKNNEWKVK